MSSGIDFAGKQVRTGVQWLQGCKWAAITVVVVASPMLGKVSQVTASDFTQTASGLWSQDLVHHTTSAGALMLECLGNRETNLSGAPRRKIMLVAGIHGADDRDSLWWAAGAEHLSAGAWIWPGLGHGVHR